MARVQLPPGCMGLEMSDGTRYDAKPGGAVDVDDRHARTINRSSNGQLGLISTSRMYALGTRKGRLCTGCHFLAQAWSETCPRCGAPTTEEP